MTPGSTLKKLRAQAEMTQADLAQKAGVSRALVSAIEAGRHLPRVDAALALARALGISSEFLFGTEAGPPVDALSGLPAADGTALRIAYVGDQPVTAPPQHGEMGWQAVHWTSGQADRSFTAHRMPALVIAGCEPALPLVERLLARPDLRTLAIQATTDQALQALEAGRVHVAAVHFRESDPPPRETALVTKIRLGRWRVGLAAQGRRRDRWWEPVLAGQAKVIQREPGASAQKTFERARRSFMHSPLSPTSSSLEGPRVMSHLAASRGCIASELAAVTIEPAARAVGADFHALETHAVEFWIREENLDQTTIARLIDLLRSLQFQRTLESVGGYQLDGLGSLI